MKLEEAKTWEEYEEYFKELFQGHREHVVSRNSYLNLMRLEKYFPLEELSRTSASLAEFISGISRAMCVGGLKFSNEHYERYHAAYRLSYTISADYPDNYLKPEQIAWLYILLNKDIDFGFLDDRDKAVKTKCLNMQPSELPIKKDDTLPEKCMKLILNARQYFKDPECTVFNWDRALEKNASGRYVHGSKKELASVYSYYMSCSKREAMAETEKVLSRLIEPEAKTRFPGWEVDFHWGKPCPCLQTRELSPLDWISFEHPFFKAHSKDPVWSAVIYFKTYHSLWMESIHSIFGEEDGVVYQGSRGAESLSGGEDQNTLLLCLHESYSYHDGGGSSDTTLKFSFVSDAAGDVEVQTTDCGIPCKGWYKVGGRSYLIDPFGMTGVFEFCDEIATWDIDG